MNDSYFAKFFMVVKIDWNISHVFQQNSSNKRVNDLSVLIARRKNYIWMLYVH